MVHKILAFDRKSKRWGEIFNVQGSENEVIEWPNGSTSQFDGRFHTKALSDSPGYWRLQDSQKNRDDFLKNPALFLEQVMLLSLDSRKKPVSMIDLKIEVSQLVEFDFRSPAAQKGPRKNEVEQYAMAFSNGINGLKKFIHEPDAGSRKHVYSVPEDLRVEIETPKVLVLASENLEGKDSANAEISIPRKLMKAEEAKTELSTVLESSERYSTFWSAYVELQIKGKLSKKTAANIVEDYIQICIELETLSKEDSDAKSYFMEWISSAREPLLLPLVVLVNNEDGETAAKSIQSVPSATLALILNAVCKAKNFDTPNFFKQRALSRFIPRAASEISIETLITATQHFSISSQDEDKKVLPELLSRLTKVVRDETESLELESLKDLSASFPLIPWTFEKKGLVVASIEKKLISEDSDVWGGIDWQLFEELDFAKTLKSQVTTFTTKSKILEALLLKEGLSLSLVSGLCKIGRETQSWLNEKLREYPALSSRWKSEILTNPLSGQTLSLLFGIPDSNEILRESSTLAKRVEALEAQLAAIKDENLSLEVELGKTQSRLDKVLIDVSKTQETEIAKKTFTLASLVTEILRLLSSDLGKVPNDQIIFLAREQARLRGISTIGKEGEIAPFEDETHSLIEQESNCGKPGEVEILDPGYKYVGSHIEIILKKARVRTRLP